MPLPPRRGAELTTMRTQVNHVLIALALVAAPLALTTAGAQVPGLLALEPSAETCGDFAPTETYCETGTHDDRGYLAHDCAAAPGYTGTIHSRLYWVSAGTHDVYCHYEDGERVDTETVDESPWFTTGSVWHRCWSYDLHTTNQGGNGFWSCNIIATGGE